MKKRKLMRTLLAALCASMLISAMGIKAMADDDVVLDDDDEEVVLDDEADFDTMLYAAGNPDSSGSGTSSGCDCEVVNTKQATCTEPLIKTMSGCDMHADGPYDVSEGEPLGHDYREDTPRVEPTCSNAGVEAVMKCSRCGSTTGGAEIKPTGKHDYSVEDTPRVEPTCTEAGAEAVMKCSGCDLTTGGTKIEPLGHDYSVEDTKKEEPTCIKDGKEAVMKCSICGEKDLESGKTIPATGVHEFSEDWSSNETGHWHECPNCDRTDGFSGHTWNDGKCSICGYGCEHKYVVEKAPVIVYCDKPYTYTVTARCSACSATRKYNGTNPAAGHDWGAKDENDVAKCSRCNVEAILDSNGNIVRILAEGEDVGREEEIVIKLPELEPEPDPDETKSDDNPEEKPEEKVEEKPETKPSADDKQTSNDKPKEDKPKKDTTSKPSDNPNSGVTMAILPLAVAAAIVIFKKRG